MLVEWDQPGAGKTYGRSGPLGPDDTVERVAEDGIALADYLRNAIHCDRVILVGVSWGSIVGVRMALQRPDLFTAYVGTGQFANMREGDALAYAQTLAKAKARGDAASVRTLERSGPPPYRSQAQLGAQRRIAIAYEPGAPSILGARPGHDLSSLLPDRRLELGSRLPAEPGSLPWAGHAGPDDQDRPAGAGHGVQDSVFFFQGDDDDLTPAVLAKAYFDQITAPRKAYLGVPGAGHFVFVTHGDAFARFISAEVDGAGPTR